MTLPIFPTLPGQGWSVKKSPKLSTIVKGHVSGREVRAAKYARALYNFELTFNALDSSGANLGLVANSLQQLMGVYLAARGQFGTFLYVDPSDNIAGNAPFGTGDGVTTVFTLQRAMGAYLEPAPYVTSLGSVTANGLAVASGSYSLTAPNTLTFLSAPAGGAALAATFGFAFQCRFSDDTLEFENFMSGLWQVSSLKFQSVR